MNDPHVYIFTDGSCARQNQVGGWAAFMMTGQEQQLLYGQEYPTTISRCELKPILEALRFLSTTWFKNKTGIRVLLTSDSEYTVQTIGGLYEPHKNKDLWTAYDILVEQFELKAQWRERNSHPLMELADSAAHVSYQNQKQHVAAVKNIQLPTIQILEKYPL